VKLKTLSEKKEVENCRVQSTQALAEHKSGAKDNTTARRSAENSRVFNV